jgi:spermidine synthase
MATLATGVPVQAGDRTRSLMFGLFFASGFCSLLYQVVWLRMAFAHFGIVTPVLSVLISVFMLGLGLGSVLGGRWGAPLCAALGWSPAALYGLVEGLIGVGAVAVPALMGVGETLLLASGAAGSARFLALSALAITVAILPWCILMGTTFPLMMGFARTRWAGDGQSFSFLYRANVLGAMSGTLVSAGVLIELFGFRTTSLIAALLNLLIAAASFWLARQDSAAPSVVAPRPNVRPIVPAGPARRAAVPQNLILFTTGFCSLAMEVVWTRAFTIVLHTTIYAFAAILAAYLLATALGAAVYRDCLRKGTVPNDTWLLLAAAVTACLPPVCDDPHLHRSIAGVLFSIMPFCAVLGFLTPKLVDDASAGDPDRAGRSYAVNIVGSILGPLVAGYVLVTQFDVRVAMLILALPIAGLAAWALAASPGRRTVPHYVALAASAALLLVGFTVSESFEGAVASDSPREVRRDYAATAIAYGTGMDKRLLVNGVGITTLTPISKVMAHLPLALHGHARDGLVICFGMGTTFRSMASWGIDTTAVDLTGAVIDSFAFFHADAATVAAAPNVHLVVDDGRRFLARTERQYDVIVIDPPPPVEAAGSSLLYSRQMYTLLQRRLRPGGILQQWFPGGEEATGRAVARTLAQSFPYVAAYRSIEGWGVHYLASMTPLPDIDAEQFAARLPPRAQRDLVEWQPNSSAASMAADILANRMPMTGIVSDPLGRPIVDDDSPFNEYFLLRRL